MCHVGVGRKCGVVEKVKRQTLKWFGHVERMEEDKIAKRVYVSEIEGGNVKGRPLVKWRDRMHEYVRERVKDPCEVLNRQGWSVRIERDGSSSAVTIPWWELLGAGVEMN